MGHKCFVSYKKEDIEYKKKLIEKFKSSDVIDKSLDRVIQSENGIYIMQAIRDEYLKDSTVTISLIGCHSSENEGYDYLGRDKNYFIKRELQASLYNGESNTRNGIVGVVIPEMYNFIFKGTYSCSTCGQTHNWVTVDDSVVVREFSVNYYIEPHDGCSWSENERYCILVKWDDFMDDPEKYINMAYEKRFSDISKKIKIYNLR